MKIRNNSKHSPRFFIDFSQNIILEKHSLTEKTFQWNFFTTYFARNHYFLKFESFSKIGEQIRFQEVIIEAKQFIKGEMMFSQEWLNAFVNNR